MVRFSWNCQNACCRSTDIYPMFQNNLPSSMHCFLWTRYWMSLIGTNDICQLFHDKFIAGCSYLQEPIFCCVLRSFFDVWDEEYCAFWMHCYGWLQICLEMRMGMLRMNKLFSIPIQNVISFVTATGCNLNKDCIIISYELASTEKLKI